jgi:hypothetical protein
MNNEIEKLKKEIETLKKELSEMNDSVRQQIIAQQQNSRDVIRNNKGEIYLKKTALIRNRKSILDNNDNVLTLSFTKEAEQNKYNYLYLGRDGGNQKIPNTTYLELSSACKTSEPYSLSNGAIYARLLLDTDNPDARTGNLLILDSRVIPGKTSGTIAVLSASGDGLSQLQHESGASLGVDSAGIFIDGNLRVEGASTGKDTTFTTVDGKTITVTKGIITGVA